MDNNNKPFNKFYVLRITSLHIKKAIDTSIRKTYDRMKDVENKAEVFETLDVLHKVRKLMEGSAKNLDFMEAAKYRDQIKELQQVKSKKFS